MADYTLLLEDDLIATRSFVQKLKDRVIEPLRDRDDWIFVRLFYPEFWAGWENTDIPVLILLALVISSLSTIGVVKLYSSITFRNGSIKLVLRHFWLLSVLLFFYFIGLSIFIFLTIGKQNIITPFPNGLYSFESKASTVSVVYPSNKIKDAMDYLESHLGSDALDILLDDHAILNKLDRLLLVPNLFQHIGLFSSNRNKNQGSFVHFKTSLTFEE